MKHNTVKSERISPPPSRRTISSHSLSDGPIKKMRLVLSANPDQSQNGKAYKFEEIPPEYEMKIANGKNETKIRIKTESKPTPDSIPHSVHLTSEELLKISHSLGTNNGKISTSVYRSTEIKSGIPGPNKLTQDLSCRPPEQPKTMLTKEELTPPTASVYINSPKEAFSPHLLDFCLKHPIVLVRNIAPACDLDLKLYTTKTLVDMHPNHPVEIRNQIEQDADENLDPTLTKPVWYCTSSRGHTTIAKYAEYQAGSLAEAWSGDVRRSVNPIVKFGDGTIRRWIKFGTNCDLSDERKWGPQLRELMKLPAWARVVSPANMLSHIGHQILGMNTVQLYMKVPCARTPGHQENNNFCAVNINIGPGDSEWFGVPNEYWGGLQRLCKKNNVNYLHGSWWPSMEELAEAGIPCYRFMQRPGDLVWVNAGCVHWVQAAGWCNNIAWNVGPLSCRQYVLALERYEWNKVEKYQSIVAMVLLSWNLARNIRNVEPNLHKAITTTLAESIRQTVQTVNFVKSKNGRIKYHGRRRNDPAHYCGGCEEEVFNTILIRELEVPHVVHCLQCAVKSNPNLEEWICLEEYSLDELCQVYDDFRTGKTDLKSEPVDSSFFTSVEHISGD